MAGFIVLIIGLILNWIPLALIFSLFFDYPQNLIYPGLIILAAGIFAISPINESIGRITLGCRPATTEETRKILGAWNQVIDSIGESLDINVRERFEKVNLFVSDEKLPNAFALGRNTVCVTKGLLNLSATSSIAGVLAHEAGHLHFGDSQRLAIAITVNQLGILAYNVLNLLARIVNGLGQGSVCIGSGFSRSGGGVFAMIGAIWSLFALVARLILQAFCFVSQLSMDLSIKAVGRNEEFRADLFAKNIGYGQPLAKFLRRIEALESAPQNIWQVLYRTHPPTAERIDRLEK
ncbi:hypothetical protein SOV_50500 [Sporomusa ovata DSM 2662]|uniref:Peptidase, M48 family n=1 Tax=Sporomusa ovata TaxID=2378 RepID=A0A0U1L1R7_9FIRM|nr:zinc metalloprotease HtpX [Sporomusa ovata]EQB27423.1 Zn-dependent protease with chaperone function [Sporomusa ovata DSM 2662]CQR73269.1 peptidase, M48 family [Sporomusa ovata]